MTWLWKWCNGVPAVDHSRVREIACKCTRRQINEILDII